MSDLSRRQFSQWSRGASGGGNSGEGEIEPRDDVPVLAPTPTLSGDIT
jgi:hypothetical protein